MNPDEHCKFDKHYSIYNIYYDTENSDVIRHSIANPYYNEKTQIKKLQHSKIFIEYYLSKKNVHSPIYIGYIRKAFLGKDDKDFRLTFESKILTRRDNLSLDSGFFKNDILEENQYLMEVKLEVHPEIQKIFLMYSLLQLLDLLAEWVIQDMQ